MKKLVLTVMVVLGVGMTQVNAQNITYGVKAEANMSNFLLSDFDNASSKMKLGATIGGFAKFDITENFAIQPELLVHYQSSELKEAGKKRDFQYWGLEVPVYAMGQWYTANDSRFYVAAGPYIGMGLDAKLKSPELKMYKSDRMNRFDFGVGAQVGYEFSNRIGINASYKIGFINAVDEYHADAKMLPQRISLGIAYRF